MGAPVRTVFPGLDDFSAEATVLRKPFRLDTLRHAIEDAVNRARA